MSNIMAANTIQAILSNYAPLISVLGAIAGAIIGVIASQVLDLYRDDLEAERKLDGVVRTIELATVDHLSGSKRTEKVRELEDELSEIYLCYSWLIDQEGLDQIKRTLSLIQKEHRYRADDDDAYVLSHDGAETFSVISELNKCKDTIEAHRRKVSLRKVWRRYIGKNEPY